MKLIILGATGGIGLELVRKAMERGHRVTAFVRVTARLAEFGDRIDVIQGDVLNSAELAKALEGQDAVLSGFGPRTPIAKTDADLLRRFAAALVSAMLSTRTRRVIVVSMATLFKDAIIPPAYLVGRLFFRDLVIDAAGMEDAIQKSGLDWTIVRPPQLTNKPRSGKYRVREGHLPRFGFKISRADVADYMIGIAENRGSVGKIVGVSN